MDPLETYATILRLQDKAALADTSSRLLSKQALVKRCNACGKEETLSLLIGDQKLAEALEKFLDEHIPCMKGSSHER